MPFVCACGTCEACREGAGSVCERQTQPGFDLPGSFAERVAVLHAAVNLVRLPDAVDTLAAAALGCRFATAYRAVTGIGRLRAGEEVAVHGCGGVGLAAVQVAVARGARVVAVDPRPGAREAARRFGAAEAVASGPDAAAAVLEATGGGAHLSLDAYGSRAAFASSVAGLRRRGRHVQVGLLLGAEADPPLPAGLLVGRELELLGSHGMAAADYPAMLAEIESGALDPSALVTGTVPLSEAGAALAALDTAAPGVTVALP